MSENIGRTEKEQEMLNQALVVACREGNIKGVEKAINSGANVNCSVEIDEGITSAVEQLFNTVPLYFDNYIIFIKNNDNELRYLSFNFDILILLLENGLNLTDIDKANLQLMLKYFGCSSEVMMQQDKINNKELISKLEYIKQKKRNKKILEYFETNINDRVKIASLTKNIDINIEYDSDENNGNKNTIGDVLFKEACVEQYYATNGASELRTRYNLSAINSLIEVGVDVSKDTNKDLLLNALNNVFTFKAMHEDNNESVKFFNGLESIYKQSDVSKIINDSEKVKEVVKQLNDYYIQINKEFIDCCAKNNNDSINKLFEIPYVNINYIDSIADINKENIDSCINIDVIPINNKVSFACLCENGNIEQIKKFINSGKLDINNKSIYQALSGRYDCFTKKYDDYMKRGHRERKKYSLDQFDSYNKAFWNGQNKMNWKVESLSEDARDKIRSIINNNQKKGRNNQTDSPEDPLTEQQKEGIAQLFKNAIIKKDIFNISLAGTKCQDCCGQKYDHIIKDKNNINILSQIYTDFTGKKLGGEEISKFIRLLNQTCVDTISNLATQGDCNKLDELLKKYRTSVRKVLHKFNDVLIYNVLEYRRLNALLLVLRYRENDVELSSEQKSKVKEFIEKFCEVELNDSDLLPNISAGERLTGAANNHTLGELEQTIQAKNIIKKSKNDFLQICTTNKIKVVMELLEVSKCFILDDKDFTNGFKTLLNNIKKDFGYDIYINKLKDKSKNEKYFKTVKNDLKGKVVANLNKVEVDKIENILKYDFAIDMLNENDERTGDIFTKIVIGNKLNNVLLIAIKNGFDYAKNDRIKNMLLECLGKCKDFDKKNINSREYVAKYLEQLNNNLQQNIQEKKEDKKAGAVATNESKRQNNSSENSLQQQKAEEQKKKEEEKRKQQEENDKIETFKKLCKENNIDDIEKILTGNDGFKLYLGVNGKCNFEFKTMCEHFRISDAAPCMLLIKRNR